MFNLSGVFNLKVFTRNGQETLVHSIHLILFSLFIPSSLVKMICWAHVFFIVTDPHGFEYVLKFPCVPLFPVSATISYTFKSCYICKLVTFALPTYIQSRYLYLDVFTCGNKAAMSKILEMVM